MTDLDLQTAIHDSDTVQYDIYLEGLTTDTVRGISAQQNEPERMLEHRLKCLEAFESMSMPTW